MTSLAVELPGLLRVLTLMILLGGTVGALLYRDRPASAGLFAATLGIWLAPSAHRLERLPARLSSVPAQVWVAAGVGVGVLTLLGGIAVGRFARASRGGESR